MHANFDLLDKLLINISVPSAVHDNGELPHHDQWAPGHEPHAWATARHAHALYRGPSHPPYHGTATTHAAHGE